MAGVNSLPSTLLTPAHSVHALAPLGWTLKSTPLAAPHISRSFSSSVSALPCLRSTFPLTIVAAASSDNILQPDKGWPPSLGERTREDSDAQARVITDRSPAIRNVSFFIVRSFFFFFLPRYYPARDITSALSLLIGRRAGRKRERIEVRCRCRSKKARARRDCFHGELGGSVTRLSFPIDIYSRCSSKRVINFYVEEGGIYA